jgi:RES domain-containing protein
MASTQIYGGDWLRSKRSAVLVVVPRAVMQIEEKFLLNPEHPDFTKIRLGKATPFELDPRLT